MVQQKQGIVKPTTRLNGVNINDDKTLESKANAPVIEMIGTDPVNGDVVQRALVGEFGFDNADPIEQKLQYFKRQDLGIEKWILTAYEFEKQNKLLTDATGAPSMVTVPDLMDKLYSLREMVCNAVTVTQQSEGAQQTGPVDPLFESESSATTKMNIAAGEKLSMVTHGMDADFLVIEEVAPIVPPPNPDIINRYKTDKQVLGQDYLNNATDTIRYYPSNGYVIARSDDVVARLRGALPVTSQPNFNPFFCFMGNSKETQQVYKKHVPPVDIAGAQGPSLLPPGNPGGDKAHGQGLVYNEATLASAIQTATKDNQTTSWSAIIDNDGRFQTVGDVVKPGKFPALSAYCNNPADKDADLSALFKPALDEIINVAFEMYNQFGNAVNAQIQDEDPKPVDVGRVF